MYKPVKAFSLIEIVVALGVFAIFAVGIYGGIQLVYKIVYQSRIKILETAILNEQVEIIRNMSFYDIGIVDGSPSGILQRNVSVNRNGISFDITRTVRSVDDPYDGTIGGSPNDVSPTDYKLVDISVVCSSCLQHVPLGMQTQIAPKHLEGDPTRGALFIEVFDAEANPVVGANVHIISSGVDPAVDMVDTTDNDGMLRLVDLASGIDAYNITVNKEGYTSDQTYTSTLEMPDPVKSSTSVIAQNVTEISFTIDEESSIELHTVDVNCKAIPAVPFVFRGTKMISREPEILKVDLTGTTNNDGYYNFPSLVWDNYAFGVSGYDVVGSIPQMPINLLPGTNQSVQMVLRNNTERSLLINVVDGIFGQPVASANVSLNLSGVSQSLLTGVGSVRQTDWSGGDGQLDILDYTRYFNDSGFVENNDPAGDLKLLKVGEYYVLSGELESSIFDLGEGVNYVSLNWEPISQPVETGINSLKFQIATSNTSTPDVWEYLGPDGTENSYYNVVENSINEIHNGQGYFRYKVFLTTESSLSTPTLSDLSLVYTNSCTPPGQVYFGGLSEANYEIVVNREGYQQYSTELFVDGDEAVIVELTAV